MIWDYLRKLGSPGITRDHQGSLVGLGLGETDQLNEEFFFG
jgi:hypothetical protein